MPKKKTCRTSAAVRAVSVNVVYATSASEGQCQLVEGFIAHLASGHGLEVVEADGCFGVGGVRLEGTRNDKANRFKVALAEIECDVRRFDPSALLRVRVHS